MGFVAWWLAFGSGSLMPKQNAALHAFNRGIVGAKALARVDLERMRLSAEVQTNWLPRSVGSMSLRPGLQYLIGSRDNEKARYAPFIYSSTDTAILEFTADYLRPIVNENVITRNAVSTTVTNGDFSSSTGWTITDTGGSTGAISGGKLTISCIPIDSYTIVSRSVSVAVGDQNVEHGLLITVDRGPVIFRAGTASGLDDLIAQTTLRKGVHSLAITPTSGTFYVEFESRIAREIIVDSIQVESAGTLEIPAFWTADDLPFLRWSQSGDVVFLACYGHEPKRIERRSSRSWSLCDYDSVGPFAGIAGDSSVKMSINKALGNATLTASRPYFKSTHVGSLFRMFTPGYNFDFDLAQSDAYTPTIRVNGVGAARYVTITLTGTWTGTLKVQRSYTDESSGFTDTVTQYTSNVNQHVIGDTADNTAVWTRVGFSSGGLTSGKVTVNLSFGAGSSGFYSNKATSLGGRYGICKVLSVTNSTSAEVEITSLFSSSEKTLDWYEGEWSDRVGWPSAVDFHEGRLMWAGRDRIWGSVSDAYSSFDPAVEGDSGPIQRSIGRGPVQVINWILPLSRAVLGTEAAEVTVRSSSFDEPLTPTNFSLKDISTYGSSRIAAVKIDTRGIFVDKSKTRVMEIAFDVNANDYSTRDLTLLCPELFTNNPIIELFVQRQPDTRIHCVREDGTVVVLVYEPSEEVKAFVVYETDGVVESGCVLPGDNEDRVYYSVKRTVDGSDVRYLERMAREDECVGGTLNKQADSFVIYSGSATTTIIGLGHLEGETVVIWGNGKDLGTKTVSGGSITGLSEPVTSAVVGLGYDASFKSTKLAYAAGGGTALLHKKRVDHLGFILNKTHYQGLRHGPDFDHLEPLPLVEGGAELAPHTIHDHYDFPMSEHGGYWDTDSRVCLRAAAPRPCTILGMVLGVTTNG